MPGMPEPEDTGVPLERIAWIVTVAICLVTALITLLSGYVGYAAVVFAIAGSAAINLR
jgi:ABC-type Fe3+-siderophore transport system permease subunit